MAAFTGGLAAPSRVCRAAFVGAACLAAVAPGAGGDAVLSGYGACRNPLFRPLWHDDPAAGELGGLPPLPEGQPAGGPRLSALPALRNDLRQCPKYNEHPSCCEPQVEQEALVPAFEAWRRWLGAVLRDIRMAEVKLEELQRGRPEAYERASHEDYARFHEMLSRLGDLLAALPGCFDAILEYVAGMLCLSCRSDWALLGVLANGTADGQPPFRVRVADFEARAVWARCRDFSRRGARAVEAMDRAQYWLELMGGRCLEKLEKRLALFSSLNSLRRGLYATIAVDPIYGGVRNPHEGAMPVIEPPPLPAGADGNSDSALLFGPVLEGQESGFDTAWPRDGEEAVRLSDGQASWEEPLQQQPRVGGGSGGGGLGEAAAPAGPRRHSLQQQLKLLPWAAVLLVPLVPVVYGAVFGRSLLPSGCCSADAAEKAARARIVASTPAAPRRAEAPSPKSSGEPHESQGLLAGMDSD